MPRSRDGGAKRRNAGTVSPHSASLHAGYDQTAAYGGLSNPLGESVKISTPVSVTPTGCSNWAESERSRVTAVQPSDSTVTCGRPRLIIGSHLNSMAGLGTPP